MKRFETSQDSAFAPPVGIEVATRTQNPRSADKRFKPIRPNRRQHRTVIPTACFSPMGFAPVGQHRVEQDLKYRPPLTGAPIPQPERTMCRARLEELVDKTLAAQLSGYPIAGAVVSVVSKSETLLMKGYGQANIASDTGMNAENTLVRIGSVSKLFTWTAIMQLHEAGLVDLDVDVNRYLSDPIVPQVYGCPVTLRNLLTHTPGLEDNNFAHMIDRCPEDIEPLAAALGKHIPAQVFPPTTDYADARFASYSNWGGALAGLVVSNIAGITFEEYVENNILQPLGMTRTTFREPLPKAWLADMATGYDVKRDVLIAQDFEYHATFAPAGSITTTAQDMARFMSAHLQGGVLNGHRILKTSTAELMHARSLSPHPSMNGSALGFYERYYNGRRTFGHAGDTLFFHADLSLLPEQGLGIFIAYNTRPPKELRGALAEAIMDEFYPATIPALKAQTNNGSTLGKYEGRYHSNRSSYSTFEKIARLVNLKSTVRVRACNGALSISNLGGEETKTWIQVEPDVFREQSGQQLIAFSGDHTGQPTHIHAAFPFDPLHRIRWRESGNLHRIVMTSAIGATCLFIVSVGTSSWANAGATGFDRLLHGSSMVLALANLTTLGLLFCMFVLGKNFPLYDITRSLRVAVTIPRLVLPGLALVLSLIVAALFANAANAATLALLSLNALAAGALLFEFHYWNVLGEKFP